MNEVVKEVKVKMQCPYCKSEIEDNTMFCPNCGQIIQQQSDGNALKNYWSEYKRNADSFEEQIKKDVQDDKKKTWSSKYTIVIIVLIFVVGIGAIVRVFSNNSVNKDEISKDTNKQENNLIQEEIQDKLEEIIEDEGKSEVPIIVEDEVLQIREFYNKIVENIEAGKYSEISLQDGSIIYYEDSKLRVIIVPKNVNGSSYRKSYYYSEDKLIFAYYEAQDAHRFYFNEEQLMRWRYSKNALDAQNAVNYDFEKTDEYLGWEYTVLEDSNILKTKLNAVIKTQFDMSNITYASATSSLSEYNMTHSPERIFDGDISKAWVEGVNGQGIGESITLYFNREYVLSKVVIHAGYQKNSEIYEKNSRPKELKISFSDGSSQVYTLQDINAKQEIILEKAVITKYISFTIQSVYQGNKYEDTVISEIHLY